MQKPSLLILGGIGDTGKKSYSGLINQLRETFQIIKIDYPGFARAKRPKKATLEADIEVIHAFIKSLNLEEITIFSHSIGTAYSFELCDPNDIGIKAIIAANPFTVSNRGLIRPLVKGIHERRLLNKWLTVNGIPVEFHPFRLQSLKDLPGYLRTAKIFRHLKLKSDMSKTQVPVLALIGDRDTLIPKQTQMMNLDLIKDLEVRHFDDGHYFVHTKAKKVAELIKEFAKLSGITL